MSDIRAKDPRRLQAVGTVLRDLLKVIKVVSLYPEGNPLPESVRRSFAEKLVDLVDQFGGIEVAVQKHSLIYCGEAVYVDSAKEESLAEMFFLSGITKLEFKEGLPIEEIYTFLDITKRFVNTPGRQADLVGMLWEGNLTNIIISTVDDVHLAAYDGDFKTRELGARRSRNLTPDNEQYRTIFENQLTSDQLDGDAQSLEPGQNETGANQPQESTEDKLDIISQGEFIEGVTNPYGAPGRTGSGNSAFKRAASLASERTGLDLESIYATPIKKSGGPLPQTEMDTSMAAGLGSPVASFEMTTGHVLNEEVKLSEEEEQHVIALVKQDETFDMYESTVELCKELLHQEPEYQEFVETVTICEKIMSEFIQHGRLAEVVNLLSYFGAIEKQIQQERPQWSDRLRQARVMSASRERMRLLVECLNTHPDIPASDFSGYLALFGQEILLGLGELVGQLRITEHHKCLVDHMATMGPQHINVVSKGLFDKKIETVCMSIGMLCRIGGTSALAYLQKVIRHESRQVRMDLVAHLKESPDDKVLDLLKVLAFDKDGEVRSRAVTAIVDRKGTPAFTTISALVHDDRYDSFDSRDQQALLNSYSRLGDEGALPFLHRQASSFAAWGDKKQRKKRQAAFEALGCNTSNACEQMLLKLAKSWRRDVRNQAREALRRRREILYGDAR